ncbi:MAG: carbohydrate kinase family protein [Anaerolineales bacterium]|nr:carbohydrate kinase family protein [Anaerolineales bacterium]
MEPTFVLIGRLRRDTLLPPSGHPLIDVPGGDPLYAAAGLTVWDKGLGLLARVGEDYPHEWLLTFEKHGWDRRGIHILPEHLDLRFFLAYTDQITVQHTNPVAHFARLELPFPKALLGYPPPFESRDDRSAPDPAAPRLTEIPEDYLSARAVHLCSPDYLTASRMLPVFARAGATTRTLDPTPDYMHPADWDDLRLLFDGLTAFLPSEQELRALFWGQTDDLWAMAEAVAACGCELVIVKRGARGQLLYDGGSKKRWEVPAYAARLADPTGVGASFCGGFLAGYQKTYDPLQAVLHGNVSASMNIEGSGVFHVLEALPGLAQARLDSLAGVVRQV